MITDGEVLGMVADGRTIQWIARESCRLGFRAGLEVAERVRGIATAQNWTPEHQAEILAYMDQHLDEGRARLAEMEGER